MSLNQTPYEVVVHDLETMTRFTEMGDDFDLDFVATIHNHGWTVAEFLGMHMPTFLHTNEYMKPISQERIDYLIAYDEIVKDLKDGKYD